MDELGNTSGVCGNAGWKCSVVGSSSAVIGKSSEHVNDARAGIFIEVQRITDNSFFSRANSIRDHPLIRECRSSGCYVASGDLSEQCNINLSVLACCASAFVSPVSLIDIVQLDYSPRIIAPPRPFRASHRQKSYKEPTK